MLAATSASACGGSSSSWSKRAVNSPWHIASAAFDAALAARDNAAAVGAVLELDDAIRAWATDPTQSDEMDRARALLRSMIVRLGDAAGRGLADPRAVVGPVVDVALAARAYEKALASGVGVQLPNLAG